MKIIFFGSSSFSLPILNSLFNSKHRVSLIVTVPASKKGRGQKVTETPVELLAKEKGIPLIAPHNLKDEDVLNQIKKEAADCFVVASYGKMIPDSLLSLCKIPLNVHPSLLPKYRGASPIISQLLDGVSDSGVSIATITRKLDAGDLFAQSHVVLEFSDDARSAEEKLTKAGALLLLKVLRSIEENNYKLVAQDDDRSSYASKLVKESGKIDWSKDSFSIHNQIRALVCWPCAYTFWNAKRIKMLKSSVCDSTSSLTGSPGTILQINKSGPIKIACGKGALEISSLQPESGKPMMPYQFSIGHHLKVGNCFE